MDNATTHDNDSDNDDEDDTDGCFFSRNIGSVI